MHVVDRMLEFSQRQIFFFQNSKKYCTHDDFFHLYSLPLYSLGALNIGWVIWSIKTLCFFILYHEYVAKQEWSVITKIVPKMAHANATRIAMADVAGSSLWKFDNVWTGGWEVGEESHIFFFPLRDAQNLNY